MKPEALQTRIGEIIGTSDWIALDQARINAFADCTGDHQFIHVNPELASHTPFGGTIAHGFLTLSLLEAMRQSATEKLEVAMSINYGCDRIRFLAPVRSGKRVRGHFTLLELEEKHPGQWHQKLAISVEIEGEAKPALIAEWILEHLA